MHQRIPLYKILFFLQPLQYLFDRQQFPPLQGSWEPFTDYLNLHMDGISIINRIWKSYKCSILYYVIIVQITVMIKISVSYVLNKTLEENNLQMATILAILLLLQVTFEQHYFQNIYQFSAKIRQSISYLLFRKLCKTTVSRIQDVSQGQILNIITMDLNDIDFTWMIAFSGSPIIFFVGMSILYSFYGFYCILGIGTLALIMIWQKFITGLTGPIKQLKNKAQDERTKLTEEVLKNLKVLKMQGLERRFREVILQKRQTQDDQAKQIVRIDALAYFFNGNINVFISLFLMVYFSGQSNDSDKIFTSIWILQLMKVWCITYGQRSYKLFINLRVLQKRIDDVLNVEEIVQLQEDNLIKKQSRSKKKKYENLNQEEEELQIEQTGIENQQPSIIFQDYCAYWNKEQFNQQKPILSNINLKISEPQIILLRGQVGHGKSSFLQALLNEIPYSTGQLNVNGSIAYVEQIPYIFPGTLKENILFGHPFNQEHYQDVIKKSCLDRDNIDDNYQVGDGGCNLSGGQKARLSLCRAFYSDSDIYLFDDVLAAVDDEVSQQLTNSIQELKIKGKIVILSTHKKINSDQVYKFQRGQIYEEQEVQEEQITILQDDDEIQVEQQAAQDQFQLTTPTQTYIKYFQEGGINQFILIILLFLVDALLVISIIKNFGKGELNYSLFLMVIYSFNNFMKYDRMFEFTINTINSMHRKLITSVVFAKIEQIQNVGLLLSRFTSDLSNIESMVMLDLTWVTEGVIDNVLIILIVSLNKSIILISVAFLLSMFKIKSLFQSAMAYSLQSDDVTRGKLNSHLSSSIQGLTLIRVYQQQNRILQEYLQHIYLNMQSFFTFLRLNALLTYIIELSLHILIICVLFFLLQSGEDPYNIGFSVLMLLQLGYLFSLNLRGQIFLDIDMQNSHRVFQTIELQSENFDGNKLKLSNGSIKFQNVSLNYSGKQALKNISFEIKGGQSIGVIGRTGSGKTSLINALLRLYEIQGQIFIDDQTNISLQSLRENIFVIPQNCPIFTQSVRFNLDPLNQFDEPSLWQVLEQIGMKEVIQHLPYQLNDTTHQFSVGQKQLLFLAKIFLHKEQKILIFDEATANIDNQTDSIIQKLLKNIKVTKIIIAHRMQTVKQCDRVFRMQDGEIEEFYFVYIAYVYANELHHHRYSVYEQEFWRNLIIATLLTLLGAFCSGSTQGLLSIDEMSLKVKIKHGSKEEKYYAEQLLPVIQQHHLLLSTLLVGNALAVETLPIILHQIAPDWMAILISAFLILLFGEIIPSAFTTGPDQLYIGTKLIPYVKILQTLLYIIVYPLGLLLDHFLGIHHDTRYAIKDIRGLLKLHVKDQISGLNQDQLKIMNSLIDLREQTVMKQAIDIKKVFMINIKERFTKSQLRKIRVKGYSRIPIYDGAKDNIVGTFKAKELLKLSPNDLDRSIQELVTIQEPLIISKDTTLLEIMKILQLKQKSVAFVSNKSRIGQSALDSQNFGDLILKKSQDIISMFCLTDLFEEMLDIELYDDDIHGTINYHNRPKQIELKVIHEEQEGIEKGLEATLLQK